MTCTCDICREEVDPCALEAVIRYYCRDCAAAHDLDVPLCKAAIESILAELKTRDPFALTLLLFNMSKEDSGPSCAAAKESSQDNAAPEGATHSGPGGAHFEHAAQPTAPAPPGPRAIARCDVCGRLGPLVNKPWPDEPYKGTPWFVCAEGCRERYTGASAYEDMVKRSVGVRRYVVPEPSAYPSRSQVELEARERAAAPDRDPYGPHHADPPECDATEPSVYLSADLRECERFLRAKTALAQKNYDAWQAAEAKLAALQVRFDRDALVCTAVCKEVLQLRSQLAAANARAAEEREDCIKAEARVIELEGQLAAARAEIAKQADQLIAMQHLLDIESERNTELTSELNAAQAESSELRRELAEAVALKELHADSAASLDVRLTSAESQLAACEAQRADEHAMAEAIHAQHMDRAVRLDAAEAQLAEWTEANATLESRLQVSQREARALKLALETALVKAGAGSSEYARSQPSDACEIEQWKAHAEGAWVDLATTRAEAEALGVRLASSQEDVDRANAELTREWSAQTVLRQELKASRAAHEQAIRERDDWHKLADERAAELVVQHDEAEALRATIAQLRFAMGNSDV